MGAGQKLNNPNTLVSRSPDDHLRGSNPEKPKGEIKTELVVALGPNLPAINNFSRPPAQPSQLRNLHPSRRNFLRHRMGNQGRWGSQAKSCDVSSSSLATMCCSQGLACLFAARTGTFHLIAVGGSRKVCHFFTFSPTRIAQPCPTKCVGYAIPRNSIVVLYSSNACGTTPRTSLPVDRKVWRIALSHPYSARFAPTTPQAERPLPMNT